MSGQRQDSVTDQMATVMRLAVEAGCYDAHDWLVQNWPARNGVCHESLDLALGHPVTCALPFGHYGAHQDTEHGTTWTARWGAV